MTREILVLARQRRMSTYDALYLDLAMRKGLPIATQDSGLIQAANECKIALFEP
ncbi:MAG: type II toxin-antitoxin system VapC family toxin [Desulfobulbaceae bacterium]|nr:type II toxin-antitoxin system VapC family toxin [Desulfobulbaceae bacterium]